MMTYPRWAWLLMVVPACCPTATAAGAPNRVPSGVNLGVTGSEGQIFQPDPKLPGKFIWKIWAQTATGAAENNGFQGMLGGVTALLFQHGEAAATMTAPHAQGNSIQQTIVATGRVHVVSLKEPGTTLDADTVTWQVRTNKLVAVGHVLYRNGKTGLTMRVPRLNADTVLKTVSFGPGLATMR